MLGFGVDFERLASSFWKRSRSLSVCCERMRSQSVSLGRVGSKTRSDAGMIGAEGSWRCLAR